MALAHVPLELVDKLGNRKFAAVEDCRHATICAAFGLDPASHWFDLPGVMVDDVKLHAAFRAGRGTTRDRVFGFVHRGSQAEPVAMLHLLPKSGIQHRELYGWQAKINDS